MYGQGGVGWGHAGDNLFHGCVCKIILERDLLHQAETLYQVPVLILVLQGTGENISADHAGVQTSDH